MIKNYLYMQALIYNSFVSKDIDISRYTGDLDKLKELNENDKNNFLNNFLIL